MTDDDLTEQEQQFIECLRELKDGGITVTRENGAWEIAMRAGKQKGRGVGATFDDAWDNVTGLKF